MMIIVYIKINNKTMQKMVRYRKAFYEKENDHQHGNKRKEMLKKLNKENQTVRQSYQEDVTRIVSPLPYPSKSNTKAYFDLYGQDILRQSFKITKPDNFLDSHAIDAGLRARMLDWMIEVTTSYKFTHKTYFDSVSLMDRFFEAEKECLSPMKLHITGVVAMLVASKMNEVYPLRVKTVFQKIGHQKIPLKEIIAKENRYAEILNFQLNTWCFFDLAMLKLTQLVGQNDRRALKELFGADKQPKKSICQDMLTQMEQICSYLSKFVLFDYKFYCENQSVLLGETVAKATIDVMGISVPSTFFTSSPILIQLCKQNLFKKVSNHNIAYPDLKNMLKFTKIEVISKVQKFLE